MLHQGVRHLNVLLWIFLSSLTIHTQGESPIAPGAAVERIATGYAFLEGPSADTYGNIYFTDIPTERILRWTPDDGVTTYRQNTNQANGMQNPIEYLIKIIKIQRRKLKKRRVILLKENSKLFLNKLWLKIQLKKNTSLTFIN